ncbi:MAG: ABC transporter substrate-binding protein [Oscillospiraceae bacterium]|nr:ABC transporter substrate-binding protein [Oscillospiraceae bacterium]
MAISMIPEPPTNSITATLGKFTLRYDPHNALNPITTLNRDNILLSSLLYESLFVLDGDLQAKPLLCENWSTEDNITFTFEIKPDVAMTDGSSLTANDVVYTLKQAMQKGRYVNRFKTINTIESDGELEVTVILFAPNSRFINLLDVPIIKSGSIDNKIPPGTGPYVFVEAEIRPVVNEEEVENDNDANDVITNNADSGDEIKEAAQTGAEAEVDSDSDSDSILDISDESAEGDDDDPDIYRTRLERFVPYRDYDRLPIATVYLKECEDSELTELFDDGDLSLLWDDPSDAFELRINRLPEKRFYNTSTLQFVGFNARRGVMKDPDVRRAISCSIDRQYIVDDILAGHLAIPSPLALPSIFWLYDKTWENRNLDPLVEMSLLLDRAYLGDFNDDSFLEISDGFDSYSEFSVDFIVNSENIHRVQIANKIADTLKRYGFNISVRELPWESFLNALDKGNFDMYYGEVVLGADFDLSLLLLPGALNYGKTASTDYLPFIEDFLAARTDYEVKYAAKRLCDEIVTLAPFAPVLYKRYAIYFPMGAISGADPSPSGVFRDFTSWTIDVEQLT